MVRFNFLDPSVVYVKKSIYIANGNFRTIKKNDEEKKKIKKNEEEEKKTKNEEGKKKIKKNKERGSKEVQRGYQYSDASQHAPRKIPQYPRKNSGEAISNLQR